MFSSQNTFKTGVYRANGSVANWKFRITLKKIYSLIEIPRFDSSIDEEPLEEPSNSEEEHLDIAWQEKVFSKSEIDYYSARDNCHTELQNAYYHKIKSSRLTEQKSRGKIFTYTAADNFALDEELCATIGNKTVHLDDEKLNMETMFVMADLDTEELLFSLAWNSTENVLFVYPDFNCMKINPYYKEIQGDSRQMYHFGIKNLSFKKWITCSQETVEIRDVFASKITRFNIRDKLSKDNFEYPENHQVQFLILLEIISGTGFSYSDIFIRYRLDIPSAAKMIAGFVDGSTHSTKQCKGRWLYGHCHEITLQLPENHKTSDDCVRIYFDIISTDSWKRELL
ncbi:tectonic-like complex member Mks1 [Toxorhynchites rutilus septentrionalis]|uniref:tectonic-like complex member Mks1 n=1 Tax=Toxorhynchites rutilus septentrionalis TaxID=329112 RepID=UPI00247AA277|nr:tectonic-like complex member Mks1 [Toxorhynchites rutilus septentrionalis]